MEGQTENFTPTEELPLQVDKITPGGQLRPWGQNLFLGAKLRMGLWTQFHFYLILYVRFYLNGKTGDALYKTREFLTSCCAFFSSCICTNQFLLPKSSQKFAFS
jgi:hypothetical protein